MSRSGTNSIRSIDAHFAVTRYAHIRVGKRLSVRSHVPCIAHTCVRFARVPADVRDVSVYMYSHGRARARARERGTCGIRRWYGVEEREFRFCACRRCSREAHRRDSPRRTRRIVRGKSRLAPPPPLPRPFLHDHLRRPTDSSWPNGADGSAAVSPDPCTFSLLRASRLSRSRRAPPLIGRHAPPLIGCRALTAQARIVRRDRSSRYRKTVRQ